MPEYSVYNKLQNWNFKIRVPGVGSASFKTAKGFKASVEIIDFREGGDNHASKKFPGRPTFDNLTLERGVISRNSELYTLFRQVYDVGTNIGREPRVTILLDVLGRDNTTLATFKWVKAIVASVEFDDLDATSSGEIFLERIEFAVEGFEKLL
jgi:phage tail-like protein